jgi:hypothetical protein
MNVGVRSPDSRDDAYIVLETTIAEKWTQWKMRHIDHRAIRRYDHDMTDRGDFILVDSADVAAELPEILKSVEQNRRRVLVIRDGVTVAEIGPVPDRPLQPSRNPKLQGSLSPDYDPEEGLREDEWPEHLR